MMMSAVVVEGTRGLGRGTWVVSVARADGCGGIAVAVGMVPVGAGLRIGAIFVNGLALGLGGEV